MTHRLNKTVTSPNHSNTWNFYKTDYNALNHYLGNMDLSILELHGTNIDRITDILNYIV